MKRLRIFHHHIYELKKGLRSLILFTTLKEYRVQITCKLETLDIPFVIYPVTKGSNKINVFFGDRVCIEVLKRFDKRYLADFTPEEDYILGIMLGYDRLKQCQRYLQVRTRQARAGNTSHLLAGREEDAAG